MQVTFTYFKKLIGGLGWVLDWDESSCLTQGTGLLQIRCEHERGFFKRKEVVDPTFQHCEQKRKAGQDRHPICHWGLNSQNHAEPQNHFGWQRPVRSLSLTINLTLPSHH